MNRCLSIFLVMVLLVNLTGCAELRKKFIRKKDAEKQEYSFYRVEKYHTKSPQERYSEHYALWHTWQLDLERDKGTSRLRDISSGNEAMRHLTSMRDLLVDEKAKELDKQIARLQIILTRVKEDRREILSDVRSRSMIGQLGRVVVNNFSYHRMKDYIKSDESSSQQE